MKYAKFKCLLSQSKIQTMPCLRQHIAETGFKVLQTMKQLIRGNYKLSGHNTPSHLLPLSSGTKLYNQIHKTYKLTKYWKTVTMNSNAESDS